MSTATTLWGHYWNMKSSEETGINQVTTDKHKMANSDKCDEQRGSCYSEEPVFRGLNLGREDFPEEVSNS